MNSSVHMINCCFYVKEDENLAPDILQVRRLIIHFIIIHIIDR